MKVDVTLETINANDLQARITAAIQSGSGADIILMLHNWPHLYANALADVSELAEWKARDQGGYYPHNEAAARAGARWLGLPWGTGGILIAYRRSWFAEVGASEPPRTLEEYRRIAVALKKKDRKSTRLNSSHSQISYAVFCLKKKKKSKRSKHDLK